MVIVIVIIATACSYTNAARNRWLMSDDPLQSSYTGQQQMMKTIVVPRDIRQLPKVLPPPSYDAPRPPVAPSSSEAPSPRDQAPARDQAGPPAAVRQRSASPAGRAPPAALQPKDQPAVAAAAGVLRNGYRMPVPSIPQPRVAAAGAARGYYTPSVVAPAAGMPSRAGGVLPPIARQNSADQLAPGARPGPRRVSCS